jgi:chromate reductase, NAD(P)H dehydrogenase (quinone)
MKVLGISGSLRLGSYNTKLLLAARDLLPEDAELELWDGLKAVPPYDEDDDVEPAPAAVARLREEIAGADAVLFATPEYNASIPGQLKNALDWVSRPIATNPLRNKPVAVIGASTSVFGAVWAQAELRKVLASIGAGVVDLDLPLARAQDVFDPEVVAHGEVSPSELLHEGARERLQQVTVQLASEVGQRIAAAA